MKRFLFLLFISGLFSIEISSIELTYGEPLEDGNTESDIGIFLLNCDTKASVNLSFKIPLNEKSSIKYFVQYATYTKDILWENDTDYEYNVNLNFYNTGIKHHGDFKIKGRLKVHASYSLGIMNTKTKSDALIRILQDITEHEEIKPFWGYDLGASIDITEKFSLILNHSTMFMMDPSLITEFKLFDSFKDSKLLYQNIALGIGFNL